MISFAKSFALNSAIASCQVSGTEAPWRKKCILGRFTLFGVVLEKNVFEPNMNAHKKRQTFLCLVHVKDLVHISICANFSGTKSASEYIPEMHYSICAMSSAQLHN